MLKVLAHPRSKTPARLSFVLQQPSTLYLIFFVAYLSTVLVPHASGQILLNGQLFTNGLSIVDAPAPQSTYHFGSGISIAIDVSGDGKLPQSASVPGNSGHSGYDGLDLYLVSSQTNTNVTVSNDSDILKQEPGSTVKHLNWAIPTCVSSGQYNLTLYECARINGQFYYTITPVLLEIENPNPSGPCTSSSGANPLQDQPQLSSPPPRSPFLPTTSQPNSWQPYAPTSSGFITWSIPGTITYTMSPGVQMSSYNPYEFTSLSDGHTVTITESAMPTTVTVVMVSIEILTSTEPGQTSAYITTERSTSTTTATINGPTNTSGFLPVNAASSGRSISFLWLGFFNIVALVLSC